MDDIEARLQRYRPAGPPPALRARLVDAAHTQGVAAGGVPSVLARSAAWFPAAAAVILIVLFSWMSSMERGRIDARVTQATDDTSTTLTTETWP